MSEEKKEEQQEQKKGQSIQVRREERAMRPFEELMGESPFIMMRKFRDDLDRMLSEFGFPTMMPWAAQRAARAMMPAVDVWETDNDVMVRADLPGVDPKDIDIQTTGDTLKLSADTKHEEERREKGVYRSERRFGHFERVIDLPTEVKTGDAKATYKNGVLEVTLPKSERAKESVKKIPVESQE